MTLRVLVIADAKIPVPPQGYGGAERVTAHICEALEAAGHSVTLMAATSSTAARTLVPYPWAGRGTYAWRAYCKARFRFSLARQLQHGPDVVFSNARIDYLLPVLRDGIPLVYNFQNPILDSEVQALGAAATGPIALVAISASHLQSRAGSHWSVIYNAIDTERLPFTPRGGQGYLAFLGRLTHNKGVDIAIRVARQVGLPLVIAGNVSDEPGGKAFFDAEVAPYLGGDVSWIGEIDDARKPAFLGGALGLLMPIRWDEPFGIVVAEALACGTPVIATPRGAMPELIKPGVNGYLAANEADMAAAVSRLADIDRHACRHDAESRFSKAGMCAQYLRLIEAAAIDTQRATQCIEASA